MQLALQNIKSNLSATGKITIRIKDQTGEEIMFKIKRRTRLGKVFNTFAAYKGVDRDSLRFLFNGERVDDVDTSVTWDLEDDDQIDAIFSQCGC